MSSTGGLTQRFTVDGACLVRSVVPRRGRPYEHRCPIACYRELAWTAEELGEEGFTLETLTARAREAIDASDDDATGGVYISLTSAAVTIAFWHERGLLDRRSRRNHIEVGCFFEEAMILYHALKDGIADETPGGGQTT